MRYFIYITLCVVSYLFYSMTNSDEYIKYQTFDEYTLSGIKFSSDTIKEPYILVKNKRDTIFVMFSNQKHEVPIKYIKKDNYWYNIIVEDNYCEPGFKCETDFNRCFEKYIYNDTIVIYQYYKNIILDENLNWGGTITIETKNSRIWLSFNSSKYIDLENKFQSVKYLVDNYKTEFLCDSNAYQTHSYQYFNKIIKGDSLFLYKKDRKNNYKFGCLYDVRKLNSLGEFAPNRGESIIDEMKLRNHCE